MALTDGDVASQLLIVSEVVISVLVLLGVLRIRADRSAVGAHRAIMLWSLALNGAFLAAFLVQDALRAGNILSHSKAPPAVFWTVLTVHLAIAVSALGVAIWSWRIARASAVRVDGVWTLPGPARLRHRRVSRWYPWLWGLTLATGLLLYAVLYLIF